MSKNILFIESSIFGAEGVSSRLAARLIEQLCARPGEAAVTTRRLDHIPHFDAGTVGAIGAGEATFADTLITEVQAADILVIGAPMYNFGIASQLKSWLDHIARAGVTFRYTPEGPEGLLTGKKTYVVTSRGGMHRDAATDVQVPYLRIMLGFLGLTDVEFIYAEGLNLGDEPRGRGMANAEAHIARLVEGGLYGQAVRRAG